MTMKAVAVLFTSNELKKLLGSKGASAIEKEQLAKEKRNSGLFSTQ